MFKPQTIKLSEIKTAAAEIVKSLQPGDILALVGPLGAGKTTFTQALAQHLKIKHPVTSPTFTIMHRFDGKLKNRKIFIYHLDLYRTKNFKEVRALGLAEFWGSPQSLTIIEWADKIKKHWPKKIKVLKFNNPVGKLTKTHKNEI